MNVNNEVHQDVPFSCIATVVGALGGRGATYHYSTCAEISARAYEQVLDLMLDAANRYESLIATMKAFPESEAIKKTIETMEQVREDVVILASIIDLRLLQPVKDRQGRQEKETK